jgi:hypothetical protein
MALKSFLVVFFVGLGFITCRTTEIDPYPDYATPSADEARRLQQSRISQFNYFQGSATDTPSDRAETLLRALANRVANAYPYTYTYADQGIAKENDLTYTRRADQLILSNGDTLFLNQQGFVGRSSIRENRYRPGGHQYRYTADGYLTDEFIPSLYSRESSFEIHCRHEYANGNRVKSTLYQMYVTEKKAVDSVVVLFEYSGKLINSGLAYVEADVLGTTYGSQTSRLEKHHASLYGKLNRNLPVRMTVQYLKADGRDPKQDGREALYRWAYTFAYTFNTKKQVTSMLATSRTEEHVMGFIETYQYLN